MLNAFLSLPYEICIPNTLFEEELLKFTAAQKEALVQGGLKVIDIPGPGVLRAQEVIRAKPRLSIHDGFVFALAESHQESILVTGDGGLKALAIRHGIEVHGLLWVVDQIHIHGFQNATALATTLRVLADDTSVRLPRRELLAAIRRYESKG